MEREASLSVKANIVRTLLVVFTNAKGRMPDDCDDPDMACGSWCYIWLNLLNHENRSVAAKQRLTTLSLNLSQSDMFKLSGVASSNDELYE